MLLLDLANLASVRQAAAAFVARHDRLDVLVHSAAVFLSTRQTTPDGLERMFATNHLGPFLLTHYCCARRRQGAPSAGAGGHRAGHHKLNFDDLQGERRFSAFEAFGATTMANLLFAYALAREGQAAAIHGNAFHPGLLRSGLMQSCQRLSALGVTGDGGAAQPGAGARVRQRQWAVLRVSNADCFQRLLARRGRAG